MKSKFTIIRDTREQDGWTFNETASCAGMVNRVLTTGDYSIEGYENLVCVERKAGPDEICSNILLPRFYREMERMQQFKYKYIVFECSLFDILRFPEGSRIPVNKRPRSINGNFLLMRMIELEVKYGVHIIYAGNKANAFRFVSSLFKRVIEAEDGQKETTEPKAD